MYLYCVLSIVFMIACLFACLFVCLLQLGLHLLHLLPEPLAAHLERLDLGPGLVELPLEPPALLAFAV